MPERGVAETLYGTVIVTAVLISVSETDYGAAEIDIAIIVTALVFALTHAWAHGMEDSAAAGRSFAMREFGRAMNREWAMVRAAFPAAAVVALAGIGVLALQTAVEVAIALNLSLLAIWGFALERSVGGTVPRAIVAGLGALALGMILVGLKLVSG